MSEAPVKYLGKIALAKIIPMWGRLSNITGQLQQLTQDVLQDEEDVRIFFQ